MDKSMNVLKSEAVVNKAVIDAVTALDHSSIHALFEKRTCEKTINGVNFRYVVEFSDTLETRALICCHMILKSVTFLKSQERLNETL